MKNVSVSERLEKLKADFETKADRVRRDRNLSNEGRAKALQALVGEKNSAIDLMTSSLRKQAIESAAWAEKTRTAILKLSKTESEKYDYARLNYEAQAVKSALVLAGDDAGKAAGMFEDARASRDAYKIKAWLELAPALMPTKTPNAGKWQALITSMENSKELLQSPEMEKLEKERREYLTELEDVKSDVDTIARELATPSGVSDGAAVFFDAVQKRGQELTARVFDGIAMSEATNDG